MDGLILATGWTAVGEKDIPVIQLDIKRLGIASPSPSGFGYCGASPPSTSAPRHWEACLMGSEGSLSAGSVAMETVQRYGPAK